jgi:hypothetical protein
MSLSFFVLTLYVLLESVTALGWFQIDPRFIGAVGIAFVVIVIFEAVRGRVWTTWGNHNQA